MFISMQDDERRYWSECKTKMSSNTYTLKIDIDDSKIRDLEKRIMAIMGMNGTQLLAVYQ